MLAAAIAASVFADWLWYWSGKTFGSGVLAGLCKLSINPSSCVSQTEARFIRWGVSSLVVAKFIPGFSTVDIPDGTLTDQNFTLRYSMNFRNTAMLTASLKDTFQKLPSDFDVLDPEGDSILLKCEEYHWNELEIKYTSNTRKLFTNTVTVRGGEFYNGTRTGISGTLSYRIQPYGSISLTGDYNDIILPPAYGVPNSCC